jgi:hypothetical protein
VKLSDGGKKADGEKVADGKQSVARKARLAVIRSDVAKLQVIVNCSVLVSGEVAVRNNDGLRDALRIATESGRSTVRSIKADRKNASVTFPSALAVIGIVAVNACGNHGNTSQHS